jgi:hypothetical protein
MNADMAWLEVALEETAAWCSERADLDSPSNCLRTPILSPYNTNQPVFEYADDDLIARPAATVERVVLARRHALGVRPHAVNTAAGRLLGYEPSRTLFSGAAQQASKGLFNVVDAPPWDTWVGWIAEDSTDASDPGRSSYLLCWTPSQFVALTDAAIWANDSDCLWWLDASRRPLAELLAHAHPSDTEPQRT